MKRRNKLSLLLAGLMALQLTACGSEPVSVTPDTPDAPSPVTEPAVTTEKPKKSNGEIVANAADLTADITAQNVEGKKADEEFILAQTKFSVELLKQTAAADKCNLLLSPYSVMQALAMTANGADGQTRSQMEQVLGNGIPLETLNEYLYTQRTNQPQDDDCKVKTANSIWMRDEPGRFTVWPEFLQLNADYYDAAAYRAPFDQSTVDDINNWCSYNTDGMIPKLLDEIAPDVVMYLINAVVFDAKWQEEYLDTSVQPRDFHAYSGETQTAEMMYSGEDAYISDDSASGFLKYYKGMRYAFAALLPDEGVDIWDYVDSLDAETLHSTLTNNEYCAVSAGIPKFSYDYGTELSEVLKTMGMPDALSSSTADFSKMVDPETDSVWINRVLHKTFIDVSEKGTKAAAITAVEMTDEAAMEEPEMKTVILDRPFVYMILDTETQLPVFIGVMTELPS